MPLKLSDDLKSESHCKAPFCKRSVALKMIASSANTYQNPLLRDMNHELLLGFLVMIIVKRLKSSTKNPVSVYQSDMSKHQLLNKEKLPRPQSPIKVRHHCAMALPNPGSCCLVEGLTQKSKKIWEMMMMMMMMIIIIIIMIMLWMNNPATPFIL